MMQKIFCTYFSVQTDAAHVVSHISANTHSKYADGNVLQCFTYLMYSCVNMVKTPILFSSEKNLLNQERSMNRSSTIYKPEQFKTNMYFDGLSLITGEDDIMDYCCYFSQKV